MPNQRTLNPPLNIARNSKKRPTVSVANVQDPEEVERAKEEAQLAQGRAQEAAEKRREEAERAKEEASPLVSSV